MICYAAACLGSHSIHWSTLPPRSAAEFTWGWSPSDLVACCQPDSNERPADLLSTACYSPSPELPQRCMQRTEYVAQQTRVKRETSGFFATFLYTVPVERFEEVLHNWRGRDSGRRSSDQRVLALRLPARHATVPRESDCGAIERPNVRLTFIARGGTLCPENHKSLSRASRLQRWLCQRWRSRTYIR